MTTRKKIGAITLALITIYAFVLKDYFFISLGLSLFGSITENSVFHWLSIGLMIFILLARLRYGRDPNKPEAI